MTHSLSTHLSDLAVRTDRVMPHVERIEELVADNMDLFGCLGGEVQMRAAADVLEGWVRVNGGHVQTPGT